MVEPLNDAEVDELLAALRAGASLSTPGSRCHSEFGHDAEGGYRIDVDEGASHRAAIDEGAVRRQLSATPDIGIALLRARRWQAVRRAVADRQGAEARLVLQAWQHHGGDADTARLVAASLDDTGSPLDAATGAALRQCVADGTLLHVFGELHGWPNDASTASACLAFIDALLQRYGEPVDDRTELRGRLLRRQQDGASAGGVRPASTPLLA